MRPTLAFFTTDDLRVRLCTSRLDELFLSYFELLVKGEIWYADALQLLNHTFLLTIDQLIQKLYATNTCLQAHTTTGQ